MPTTVEEKLGLGLGSSISRVASTVDHSFLDPLSFFVSWQGVLTLAYKGFPPALAQFKNSLNNVCPELPKENAGSKWPKTSLGALKDNQRLTPEQLAALMTLCRFFQESLQRRAVGRVLVDHLTLVMYKCRSLEQCIERTPIGLNPQKHVDDSGASQSEQDNVQAVLQEADHPSYWVSASKDGNRESHYRGVALGCTLVADLCHSDADLSYEKNELLNMIRAFREEVDYVVPGMYAWFEDSSLHVTVRALMV